MTRAVRINTISDAIVDTIREPLVVLDANFCVIMANKSFYRIFHVTKKDTENKSLYELGNGQWNIPKLKHLLTNILPKKSWFSDFEIEQDFPVIGKRIFLLNARKVIQSKNNKPMVLLAIEDITERMHIEEQKDDFIGIASHELKTPVTSIKMYGQILKQSYGKKDEEKTKYILTKMDEQINRLNELVASFVNVYKLKTGKLILKKKKFNLSKLVTEIIGNFQYTINTHTITQEGETDIMILADKERISQVLINIISNAVKYSQQPSKIIVGISKDKKRAIVSVQDFGMGIPIEQQSKVFERFFRVKGMKESKIPGLGLGLFISNEIVKQHKGELWLVSKKDKGTTFYFSLPMK